ncbi:MAG TPA: hypothetical protein VN836_05075 [Verrucomicrobiae bacterium]|nr:hypothetical protein [Verrucomicrobiae bacterium]
MKKSILLAASLIALNLTPVFGQPAPMPPSSGFQQRLQTIVERANSPGNQPPVLTRFNLDFPGGTPAELVKAIEKAMGKPLNTIIADEDANAQLPPLKMNHVDVAQLFQALEAASRKAVSVESGNFGGPFGSGYSQQWTGYSFKTTSEPLSDDSIWYFHVEKPSLPQVISSPAKVCRFYPLTPFLDRGFTVDDITTAIQTGWKMAGVTPPPELNYHKETKLLIAFGEPGQLQTIQDVLNTLPQTQYSLPALDHQMKELQDQVAQLKAKMASQLAPPASLPEEKSGK